MANITYDLIKEPKGKLYFQLLDYALEVCSSFLVVVRHSIDLDTAGRRLLDKLKPFLVESYESSEWPSTRLMDTVATVSKYKYDRNSVGILQRATHSLYGWEQPKLPEDLCLLRSSGRAWLTTTTHERDGYFEVDEDELLSLLEKIPELRYYIKQHNDA